MIKKNTDEHIMQISKEITIKFIETGRLSPNSFPEIFRLIYQSVDNTIKTFLERETEGQDT